MVYKVNRGNKQLHAELKNLLAVLSKDNNGLSGINKTIRFCKGLESVLTTKHKLANESKLSLISKNTNGYLCDESNVEKFNLNVKSRSGANGKSYLKANSDASVVVKEVDANNNMLVDAALREHHNILAAQLDSEIMYDPEQQKIYFTMPFYAGDTVLNAIESRAEIVGEALENNDQRLALSKMREMFKVLLSTLEALDNFHKTSSGLVHGDLHLGNAIINDLDKVHLIDFGGCCDNGIKAEQYYKTGIIVGSGGFYTPPEIPTTALTEENAKFQEYTATISVKSDLHTVLAGFIVNGLATFDGFGQKPNASGGTKFSNIVSEFSNWALLYGANSDWLYRNLPRNIRNRLTEERNQLMQQRSLNHTVELRAEVNEAIAKVKDTLNTIDALVKTPDVIVIGTVAERIKQFEKPMQHKLGT